jgi:L-lactate dehydrogenase complex protein LldG
MSAAREQILRRIAAATAHHAPPEAPPREYRRAGARSTGERVALFCERVDDYRAEVRQIAAAGIAVAVAGACRARGARRLVVPRGLPASWRPAGLELVDDDALTPRELDSLDGVVTGCTVAIAETGTIVLTAGPREGRRAISLVPDLHVCIVEREQIVELVPEAIARLGELVGHERRPITFVSGPSATSDIELDRVEGVHGPRNLVVLVATEEST